MATLIAILPTILRPKIQSQSITRRPTLRYSTFINQWSSSSSSPSFSSEKSNRRGWSVVTRSGPSTTSVVFAFVFPLTLLIVTVIAAIRVDEGLDQKFLEETAINEAIMGEEDEDEDDEEGRLASLVEKMPTPPATTARARNRPKREA
ncbi:hypothetical protein Syun_001963 [Stephania yunnanensis]|uniref:Uncharacterized protein n=1 Tax=Stephania yunnanensis TaxID=152371 RepID=A0AAP0Q7M1_9MAGN